MKAGMVFVDVDTQVDFMLPAGKLYVPRAEQLIPNLAKLMTWAREHNIPVLSTADAHSVDDPEFAQWPPHCVAGSHVDDLMTQDAGKLALGIRQGQQPARDVDVPVGKGKGVRLRLVDDLKGVGDVLSGGLLGDPPPHGLHVGQEHRIGDEPHARFDLAGLLGA